MNNEDRWIVATFTIAIVVICWFAFLEGKAKDARCDAAFGVSKTAADSLLVVRSNATCAERIK